MVGRVGVEPTMFGDEPSLVPDDSNTDRLWKESYSVIQQMTRQCGCKFACTKLLAAVRGQLGWPFSQSIG